MNTKEEYTLEELALETGVEPRTIRFYFQNGLLRGADRTGRGARYGRYHANHLKVIKLVRSVNRKLPLAKIRLVLQALTDSQIEAMASGRAAIGALIDTDEDFLPDAGAGPLIEPSDTSLRRSIAEAGSMACSETLPPVAHAARAAAPHQAQEEPEKPPLERIVDGLSDLAGSKRVPETTRSQVWHEIEITPDIRLSVRGAYGSHELSQFHRIADHLRDLLMGGLPGEQQ